MPDLRVSAQYEAASFAVARVPLLPLETLSRLSEGLRLPLLGSEQPDDRLEEAWRADRALTVARVRQLFADPHVNEAIQFASDDLWSVASGDLAATAERRKWHASLYRYFARMSYRATPFGLFASCGLLRTGGYDPLFVTPANEVRRNVRVDGEVVQRLYERVIAATARTTMEWRVNETLRRVGDRWRYVERPESQSTTVSPRETEAHASAALDFCIAEARAGICWPSLVGRLVDQFQVSPEEADAYLQELRVAQVIIPAAGIPVYGSEPFAALASDAERYTLREYDASLAETIEFVERALGELSSTPIAAERATLIAVEAALRKTVDTKELRSVFHVEAYRSSPHSCVPPTVIEASLDGLEVLAAMWAEPDPTLTAFRERFIERFESRFVPLIDAVDEDVGVGMDDVTVGTAAVDPLLRGLPIDENRGRIRLGTRVDTIIARKMAELWAQRGAELVLTPNDVRQPGEGPPPLPELFSALVTVVQAAASDPAGTPPPSVLVHNYSCTTAGTMLGRFAHGDAELRRALESHLQREQELYPEAIAAEVVHLPLPRAANVVSRPMFGRAAVPYLGRATVSPADCLDVRELLIGVVGERLVLWSPRHNREVRPRMSAAHAAGMSSNLPLYRLLFGLQRQELAIGMYWHWSVLQRAPRLPRVRAGRAILAPAQWNVPADELHALRRLVDKPAEIARKIRELRERRDIPRHVVLAQGDFHLPIDLESPLAVESLVLSSLQKPNGIASPTDFVTLQESLISNESWARGIEGRYAHELVIPFVRRQSSRVSPPAEHTALKAAVRRGTAPRATAVPGSNCLFLKIYCAPAMADRILLDCISPVLNDVRSSGAFENWFFIRYADPRDHLRIRVFGNPSWLLTEALPRLKNAAESFVQTGLVANIVVATYEPEIGRYGGEALIGTVERLFGIDSDMVVALLDAQRRGMLTIPRLLIGTATVDTQLAEFGLDVAQRLEFVTQRREQIASMLFRDHPDVRRLISERFRSHRALLDGLLAGDLAQHGSAEVYQILAAYTQRVRPLVARIAHAAQCGEATAPLADIVASVLHMHVNRLAAAAPNHQECVINAFLAQHYRSRLARRAPSHVELSHQ